LLEIVSNFVQQTPPRKQSIVQTRKPIMRKLSWEQAEKAIEELGDKIKVSGFKPNYIIGITTGGLIPLYFLAKQLDIDNILTVSASSYEKDKRKETVITYLPEIDLKNKKVLLVDEIAETGESLKKMKEAIVKKYKVGEIKTATIGVNKDKCTFEPDYWIITERGGWVVFPWEREDFPEYFVNESPNPRASN